MIGNGVSNRMNNKLNKIYMRHKQKAFLKQLSIQSSSLEMCGYLNDEIEKCKRTNHYGFSNDIQTFSANLFILSEVVCC